MCQLWIIVCYWEISQMITMWNHVWFLLEMWLWWERCQREDLLCLSILVLHRETHNSHIQLVSFKKYNVGVWVFIYITQINVALCVGWGVFWVFQFVVTCINFRYIFCSRSYLNPLKINKVVFLFLIMLLFLLSFKLLTVWRK